MTTSIRYTGTAQQFFELALTGRARQWTPGQQQDVSDAEAATLIAKTSFVPASPQRARSAAQLAGTPSAADIALSGEFFLYTDPTQRYVVNTVGTAYASAGGGTGISTIASASDYAASVSTPLATKQSLPLNWNGTTPALASGTSPVPAFGSNAFTYTGAGGAVLDGNTFQTGDLALWNGTAFTRIALGGGYVGSSFASAAALQTAYPAASNPACVAIVGGVLYFSNGASWSTGGAATLAGATDLGTFDIASNNPSLAAVKATAAAAIPSAQKGAANGVAGLDGSGKVPTAQLPAAVLGALNYQGTYNASTNTPAIVAGNKGFFWTVATAGTSLGINWLVGDKVVDNGTTIEKIDGNIGEVITVAGQAPSAGGNVSIALANLSDGAAQQAAITAAATAANAAIPAAQIGVAGGVAALDGNIHIPAAQMAPRSILNQPSSVVGSLTRWQAAKARGTSNPARKLWFGDSNLVGEGAASGTLGLNGSALLGMTCQFSIAAGHQYRGNMGDQNVYSGTANAVTMPVYDPRFTLGSGWSSDSSPATLGGAFLIGAAAGSGQLTFAPGTSFDTFEVWYPTVSTGTTTAQVLVDGTVIDTINMSGANGFTHKTYSVAAGIHTISFNCGATGSVRIAGILPYTRTGNGAPISIKAGWCGVTAAQLNVVTNPWSPLSAAVAVAPDFTTLYCTINDIVAATALATYLTSMEAMVSALSAVSDGCIVIGFPCSAAGTTNGLIDTYRNQLMCLAHDYGWSLFDSRTVFGRSNATAVAKGFDFDANHPSLSGHTAFGAGYYPFLASLGF